ncbi:MAG: hypothetical protein Tp1111DCM511881_41 [Prokaryotic dsDNA virus sp.]|mgnify:FL=1|nr:MAG: hypothetical protein Tp1111DCM511881_41 [Prokaryotic dsDNA virus sp.]
MASNIIRMVLKLDDQASDELKDVSQETEKTTDKTKKLAMSAGKAALGLAAAGVAAAAMARSIISMGQEVADKVNLISDMSVSTGLAVESLENLQLMARATGVNLQGMERGFVTFARNLSDARKDIGPLSEALSDLGLDANQFEDTDDAFRSVMRAISGVTDKAEQARLMNDAFGMSSKDLAKAMQTQFGSAGQALDRMGLRISESAESAAEAQRGLALYELVLDKIKRSAFEAFMGSGGFAQGLSVVVGVAKGLATLLVNIKEFTVGLFMAVAKGIYSMQLLIQGELEKSNKAAKEAQEEMARYGGAIVSVLKADFITDAVDGAKSFQKNLKALGNQIETDVALMTELDRLQKDVASSASAAADSTLSLADALSDEEQRLKDLGERTFAVKKDLDALNDTMETHLGIVTKKGRGYYDLAQNMDDMRIGAEGVSESVRSINSLAEEFASISGASSMLQRQLMGDTDAWKLLRHESRDLRLELFELSEGYRRTAAASELDFAKSDSALSSQIQQLQSMRLVLAQLMIEFSKIEPAFENTTYAQNIKALIDDIKSQIEELDVEVKFRFTDDDLRDIPGAISLGAGLAQSVAGGDVSGAGLSLADHFGASPMVKAIIGGIGAIAEIGQMTVKEIKQNAKAFAENLSNGIKVIAKALPEVIIILLRELPVAILQALITFIPLLYASIVNAFKEWWNWRGSEEGQEFREERRDTFFSKLRDISRAEMFGARSFSSGAARVNRTGMALIHRNETIIPAGGRAAQDQHHRMGGASGITVNISTAVMDRDVIPRLVREIDRVVGTYGRTTAAFAGS